MREVIVWDIEVAICLKPNLLKSCLFFLGIMTSERMNFLVYFSHVQDKVVSVVGKVILTSDWDLSRHVVRVIFGRLFVSCTTFGAPVW